MFLSNVTCPTLSAEELSQPLKVHCSSHAGTYFGEIGLTSRSGDTLYIAAGAVSVGFTSVQVNGVEMSIGQSHGTPPLDSIHHELHTKSALAPAPTATVDAEHSSRPSMYVHRVSARSLIVHAGLYEMVIENSDNYVDLVTVRITSWTHLMDVMQPQGMLGATWNSSIPIPPVEEQHREQDGRLMGCNIPTDKHCSVASESSKSGESAESSATISTLTTTPTATEPATVEQQEQPGVLW